MTLLPDADSESLYMGIPLWKARIIWKRGYNEALRASKPKPIAEYEYETHGPEVLVYDPLHGKICFAFWDDGEFCWRYQREKDKHPLVWFWTLPEVPTNTEKPNG